MRISDWSSDVCSSDLLKLEEWRRGGIEDFQKNRQALQRAATAEAGARLGLARLDLARFYFAHALGCEALGVLQMLGVANPRLARGPVALPTQGASGLMRKGFGTAVAIPTQQALPGARQAVPGPH